jgi:hypothetical protein
MATLALQNTQMLRLLAVSMGRKPCLEAQELLQVLPQNLVFFLLSETC